ncbi:Alternative oxidase [Phytophthora citrophthora]|uniref:Alternative oxidase n=1 Tax=Phytophthora citrophthora TaxID=4793 RepID=A0AAD9LE91_9STRA|nr:Alternative oxidase [Phytophthora citrophthora]
MMFRRQILRSGVDIRAYFGFAPHQLSGVTQAHTDKSVCIVKPHSLPILPSHFVWRVFASPVASTGKLTTASPMKLKLSDVKWTAAPLPELHDMAVEPMALNHITQMSRKRLLVSKGTTKAKRKSSSKKAVPHLSSLEAIEDTPVNNLKPKKMHENVVSLRAKTPRSSFSLLFDYRGLSSSLTPGDWLNRCLYIETVARASEMVVGIAHRLRSQHSLNPGDIWPVENERIHMQIFLSMKQGGLGFQAAMLAAQSVFFPVFFLTYMVSPNTCHRFVDFVEQEAVKTYTYLLEDMEHGHLDEWCAITAPLIGRSYYDLPDDAKVYDMIKCIRAEKLSRKHASLEQKAGVDTFMSPNSS